MAIAYIDSTCLYGIIDVLSRSAPSKSYEWAWKTSIETSCALIASENVRLAPSPTTDGPASGSFGQLTKGLGNFVGLARGDPATVIDAKNETKAWAHQNQDLLIRAYDGLKDDRANYAFWLDWALFNIWEEHSRRLNGLFDPEFIPEISSVLNASESDLVGTWKLSRDPDKAALLARRRDADSRFELTRDAYVVSALIRGRYHDFIARGNSWQVMHHPLRDGVFPEIALASVKDYPVSNTELYFSNILMAAAFSEGSNGRVNAWLQNIMKAREAVRSGEIDLRSKDNDEVALRVAVRAAKVLDMRFHSRRVDQVLGAASSLGVGSLASFSLTGWLGIVASAATTAAGLAAQALAGGKHPARQVVDLYSAREGRIRDLAQAGPGRIRRNWRKS